MKQYSVKAYTSALNGLLPTGMAWTRTPDSVMSAVVRAIARSYHRSDQDVHLLLEGSFPATATIMLPEWEKSLGLPDDCAIGEIDSISLHLSATKIGGLQVITHGRAVEILLYRSGGRVRVSYHHYRIQAGQSRDVSVWRCIKRRRLAVCLAD